jgi:hypothetical protein
LVVVAAGWLADVEADRARGTVTSAAGIEGTARFAMHDLAECIVEVVFEQGLEAAENEVAAAGGEDDEGEVEGDEVFAEGVPFDAGERGDLADGSV